MRNLVIMPAMAQNRERMNLGEYAEEATIIVDEPVWGIERSGFFNGRKKWAKGFENQMV